jgi:nitrile hydratase accessory protein
MAVRLHEAGYFTWREWTERLAREIKQAQERGDPDLGTNYYEHWLAALEAVLAEKGLVRPEELAHRKAEWAEAARETPTGQPIVLRRK